MITRSVIITFLVIFSIAASDPPSKPTEETELKHLSLTVNNVRELITGGYVYVDKTEFIVRMLKSPERYFLLTRPRHFGKTTFMSTVKEIFENANKSLFVGTAIHKSDFLWPTHPVVSISLSDEMPTSSPEEFKSSLIDALKKIGTSYEILSLEGSKLRDIVQTLISMLHQKFSKQVMVLIDAYDFPYGEVHEYSEKEEKISEILRGFFSAIYSMNKDIRLCLVTGVLRLISCNLQEWTDLTFEEEYATVAGFTQEEVEIYFAGHIDNVVKSRPNSTREQVLKELKNWYHGHQFTTSRNSEVYNPWNIISYFISKKVDPIGWPQWLSAKFLGLKRKIARYPDTAIDYLHGKKVYPKKYFNFNHIDRDYDEQGLNELETLLLMTGCLSIKKYVPRRETLKLGFTNREAQETFFHLLLKGFGKKKYDELRLIVSGMKSDLVNWNLKAFVDKANEYTTTFLANATEVDDPLSMHLPRNKITNGILHVIFRTALIAAEMDIDHEVPVIGERIDWITLFIDGKRYLFETKLWEDPLDVCIQRYEQNYKGEHVVCVGLKFDTKTVRIVDCDAAELSEEGVEVKRELLYPFEHLVRQK